MEQVQEKKEGHVEERRSLFTFSARSLRSRTTVFKTGNPLEEEQHATTSFTSTGILTHSYN